MSKTIFTLLSLSTKEATYRSRETHDLRFEIEGEGVEKRLKLIFKGYVFVGKTKEECLSKLRAALSKDLKLLEAAELQDTAIAFP